MGLDAAAKKNRVDLPHDMDTLCHRTGDALPLPEFRHVVRQIA
jgi:hypothetical protein